MARPTVMTPEVIAKLEESFEWGCSDREACLHADISEEALYLYQGKNPSFTKRKALLKENPILVARKSVVGAMKRNPELSLKFLERKNKAEFSLRSELTGPDGKDLPTPILGGASVKSKEK